MQLVNSCYNEIVQWRQNLSKSLMGKLVIVLYSSGSHIATICISHIGKICPIHSDVRLGVCVPSDPYDPSLTRFTW